MPFISQSNFLQALGWAVINSLWQMAVLWLIYHTYNFVFKPGSAAKSKSAFIFLTAGTAWFIINFIIALFSSANFTSYLSWNNYPVALKENIIRWLPFASVTYLIILTIPVARFFINIRQVHVIRKRKLLKIEVQWRLFVNKMAAYLEIRKPVQVWISEQITIPVTVGFIKPVILVPLAAINHLEPQQMEAVLLHELAHIKRNDYLINLVIAFIKTLFYFNPFACKLANVIEKEREISCDEWVLQYQYNAYSYSSALLILEKIRTASYQLILAASSGKELLLNRVKKIMGLDISPVYSFRNILPAVSGLALASAIFISLFTSAVRQITIANAANGNISFVNYRETNQTAVPASNQELLPGKNQIKITARKSKINSVSNTEPEITFIPDIIQQNYIPAGLTETIIPLLEAPQEAQVKEALDASKKIIKEMQWKEIEKTAADALNSLEKNKLQQAYNLQLENADWKNLADRFRLSYKQIDWDNLKVKLNVALQEIQTDSLVKVYMQYMNAITAAQHELTAKGLQGIPDTGISLAGLAKAKKEATAALQKLKMISGKKIIRL